MYDVTGSTPGKLLGSYCKDSLQSLRLRDRIHTITTLAGLPCQGFPCDINTSPASNILALQRFSLSTMATPNRRVALTPVCRVPQSPEPSLSSDLEKPAT